jgi:D-aminoacyl-tRNA deacylase
MAVKEAPNFVSSAVLYLLHPNRGRLQWSNHMRAVVQRVSRAQVTVEGEITGEIGLGLLALVGVGHDDTEADAIYLAEKIAGQRVFEDDAGKMNLGVRDVSGSVLAVSQFTLYGNVRKGKRPSFDAVAAPERARALYDFFVERIRAHGLRCETGRFQAMMKVELVNEGPVTILIDSKKEF